MFKDRTVFVIGAGASAELGLPVGTQLAKIISELMRFEFHIGSADKGDEKILGAWRQHFNNENEKLNEHLRAARRISDGILLAQSIDRFLDIHAEDEEAIFCGKTAIVRSILEAEKSCSLYYSGDSNPRMIDFTRLNDAWLTPFFAQLIDRRQKSDLDNLFNGITIICFNYDRCIEHYLIHALQRAYAIPQDQAASIVSNLEIYHPYGTVGNLNSSQNGDAVEFGGELYGSQLIGAANSIRTFTEQVEDEKTLAKLKQAIMNAQSIVFLGFAYHLQNMEILKPAHRGNVQNIFGTALGISDHGAKETETRLKSLTALRSNMIEVNNSLKCKPFLEHYQLSL